MMTERRAPQAGDPVDGEQGVQLSLLQGFAAPASPPGSPRTAAVLPIAKVLLESPLPHLDRIFDYTVPAELDDQAKPGVRVKVRFGGRELDGFLTERAAEPGTGARLNPLLKVVSSQPVLSAQVLELAQAVAARFVGNTSDVLRVAVPPRMARVEKEFPLAAGGLPDPPDLPDPADPADPSKSAGAELAPVPEGVDRPGLLARYQNGADFLTHLADGGSPRAVLTSVQGYGPASWAAELASVLLTAHRAGRGAIAVLPDHKSLDRLQVALATLLPADEFARLSTDDGPTQRYRSFLRILHGRVRIVIGTRAAAYAPVHNLGLLCCWDDGNDLYIEQRAPYAHTREVLLLRARQESAALLLSAVARTPEAQRLINTGWAQPVYPERSMIRRLTPRVINTADSFEQERDPLVRAARLPHAAWRAAQEGLKSGPVLVQVGRAGYAPAVACQQCREPARCMHCRGPLAQADRSAQLSCRWCARGAGNWQCPHCSGRRLRIIAIGANRTAEELGRAFPSVPVISSAGDHIRTEVPDAPALVVATAGAEPVALGGYAAALLLDGDSMLSRETLRAGQETLRRWFNAAALVRPAKDGGQVVVTASQEAVVGSLIRWDPGGFAERELAERGELSLPPSLRVAALTGEQAGLTAFLHQAKLPDTVRVVGPAPVAPAAQETGSIERTEYRVLLFFSYAAGPDVTGTLRAVRAAAAAKKTTSPVQIRCDAVDVL